MSVSGNLLRLLVTASVGMAAASVAGEVERFVSLERDALRNAERRLPELFDRDTGEVLAAPSNDAERYVIARESRWHAQMQERPRLSTNEDGVTILEHSPASAATTWLVVGEDGSVYLQCDAGDHDRRFHSLPPSAASKVVR